MDRATQQRELERIIQEFLWNADEPQHTFELPDEVLAAIVELDASYDEASDADEPTAPVGVLLSPGHI